MERKKVCSVMDCQKLSREASAHAAQNDRLPVQTVVQVLYYEQQRLRDAMDGSSPLASKFNLYSADSHGCSDELSNLQRENKELKLELVNLKMRLEEIEKSTLVPRDSVSSPMSEVSSSTDKLSMRRKTFMNYVSQKLARLSPFSRADGVSATSPAKRHAKPCKTRRHSVS